MVFEKEGATRCQSFCLHFQCVWRGPGTLHHGEDEEEPLSAWCGSRGPHIRSVWGLTVRALFRHLKVYQLLPNTQKLGFSGGLMDQKQNMVGQGIPTFYSTPGGAGKGTRWLISFLPCGVPQVLGPS